MGNPHAVQLVDDVDRAPVGTQAYSGDAVVYVDLSEASPVDAFVEDSVDGVGAPRKPKPGESITRAVSGE